MNKIPIKTLRAIAGFHAASLLIITLFACSKEDVAKSWDDVISKCAKSQLFGRSTLFFGMSNNVGPGSIWRATERGGFNLRWLPADLDKTISDPAPFIQLGATSSCGGTRRVSLGFSPSVLLEAKIAPIELSLATSLNKATDVAVEIEGWSVDQLREGPFEVWAKSLSDNFRNDLGAGNRLAMVKAVKISGISIELTFDKQTSADLRTKLSEGVTKVGKLGVSLRAEWKSTTVLRLESKRPFYILGELSLLKKEGSGRFPASGTSSVVLQKGTLEIPKDAAVSFDETIQTKE